MIGRAPASPASATPIATPALARRLLALAAVCAALSALLGASGTFAYLTSTSQDVNSFSVGSVSISLAETPTGLDADGDAGQGALTNSYEMTPGAAVPKDPSVTVGAGSTDCWLFVRLSESANFGDFLSYEVADGWQRLAVADGAFVPGVYFREVPASGRDEAFSVLAGDCVTVGDVPAGDIRAIDAASAPTLTVEAFAVQRAGVPDAATAWGMVCSEAS